MNINDGISQIFSINYTVQKTDAVEINHKYLVF
jgi:hypothetical protein